MRTLWLCVVLLLLCGTLPAGAGQLTKLFDFETAEDVRAWTMMAIPEVTEAEPPVTCELSDENVFEGKHSLKLTYSGGRWPAVGTTTIPVSGDWSEYQTLTAYVTVSHPSVVAVRVLQEKSDPTGMSWEAGVSRVNGVSFLVDMRHRVSIPLHDRDYALNKEQGKVTAVMFMLLNPRPGEAMYIDGVNLDTEAYPPLPTKFQVLGTKLEVANLTELWSKTNTTPPSVEPKTAAQVEEEFSKTYQQLKRTHPKAVLTVFREGRTGYDPAHPQQIYHGWRDAYINVHSPLGPNPDILQTHGAEETAETFMRHRSQLIGIDVSSIPSGARLLKARLVLTVLDFTTDQWMKGWTVARPNLWVAEACGRPWKEMEVNGYEAAKDDYWWGMSGQDYGHGDFLPLYLTCGPAIGKEFGDGRPFALWWDFTKAVQYWTDGQHANYGFFFHGGGEDSPLYLRAYTKDVAEMSLRPALLVIFEPKQ